MAPAKKKKPGPEGPGHPGNPPLSRQTPADPDLNQPIADADSRHGTAFGRSSASSVVSGTHLDAPNPCKSGAYSDETSFDALQRHPETPDSSTRLISRRVFTDPTGRLVEVRVVGAYDAGIRRAWVDRMLAHALRRLDQKCDEEGDSALDAGVPVPVQSEPPALSG